MLELRMSFVQYTNRLTLYFGFKVIFMIYTYYIVFFDKAQKSLQSRRKDNLPTHSYSPPETGSLAH